MSRVPYYRGRSHVSVKAVGSQYSFTVYRHAGVVRQNHPVFGVKVVCF